MALIPPQCVADAQAISEGRAPRGHRTYVDQQFVNCDSGPDDPLEVGADPKEPVEHFQDGQQPKPHPQVCAAQETTIVGAAIPLNLPPGLYPDSSSLS